MSPPGRVTSSLLPREKGAWGQVLLPIATGLAIAHARWPALAFAATALCAFFAHEPVLVLLGGRGDRTRRGARGRALRWAAGFGVAGLAALVVGLALSPSSSRLWVSAPVALSVASLAVLAAGRERTTAGEILAAVAVSSWIVPMGAAAGARVPAPIQAWIAYVVAFSAATLSVRGVLDGFKRAGASPLRTAGRIAAPLLLAGTFAAWLAGQWPIWIPVALAPTLVTALALTVLPVHPKQLKSVGWTLIASTTFLALVLAASLA